MNVDPASVSPRWLACFDFLGSQDLRIRSERRRVVRACEDARDRLRRQGKPVAGLEHAWSSDTFLIVAPDDFGKSFTEIDLLAQSFAYFLLCAHIPFRGAISCGRVYANFSRGGVFFGLGLSEACEYGHSQDWVGLVLCPSATSRLDALGVSLEDRGNWQRLAVPWTHQVRSAPPELLACRIGEAFRVAGYNPGLQALKEMCSTLAVENTDVRRQYSRAIAFIETSPRGRYGH